MDTDATAKSTLPARSAAELALGARQSRLTVRTKTLYGVGAVVGDLSHYAVNAFLLFYLTVVCGISGTAASAMNSIGLGIDAFVDPLMGSISDNAKSRWGRRHPFLIVGTFSVALGLGLLFSAPRELAGDLLLCYVLVVSVGLRCGQSAFGVPYIALGAELTDDYQTRSVIAAYRCFFGLLAAMVPFVLGYSIFMKGPALMERHAYVPFAWSCALLILVCGTLCTLGTLNTRERLHPATSSQGQVWQRLRREVFEAFRNRSFRLLFLVIVTLCSAQGTAIALGLHVNKFFWELSDRMLSAYSIALPVGSVLGIPIVVLVGRIVEKKSLVIGGILVLCFGQTALPLLRILNLIPGDGLILHIALVANAGVIGLAQIAILIGFQSLIADAIDEHELLFGARREGIYFAGLSFALKVALAVGSLVAGLSLDAIGFPTAQLANGASSIQVGPSTARYLALIQGPGVAIVTALCAVLMVGCGIDRQSSARTLAELNVRRLWERTEA